MAKIHIFMTGTRESVELSQIPQERIPEFKAPKNYKKQELIDQYVEKERREWEENLPNDPEFAKLLDITVGVVYEHDWSSMTPDGLSVAVSHAHITMFRQFLSWLDMDRLVISDINAVPEVHLHNVGDDVTYNIFKRMVIEDGYLLKHDSKAVRMAMTPKHYHSVSVGPAELDRYYNFVDALEVDRIRFGTTARRDQLDKNMVYAAMLRQIAAGKLPRGVIYKFPNTKE